jgi:hypothetical protein
MQRIHSHACFHRSHLTCYEYHGFVAELSDK